MGRRKRAEPRFIYGCRRSLTGKGWGIEDIRGRKCTVWAFAAADGAASGNLREQELRRDGIRAEGFAAARLAGRWV
jgi:hypothetical protein